MVIKNSVKFVPGVYALPDGITIAGNNLIVDFAGSEFIGVNFTLQGIKGDSVSNITIMNAVISGYYYAAVFRDVHGLYLKNSVLSGNWKDPSAFLPTPPWLDINVTPEDFGDKTNLGGGLFLQNVTEGLVQNNKFENQENGVDCFYCHHLEFRNNSASNNVGWGFHLYKSSWNKLTDNIADYCMNLFTR
jgi:parallel beta-helix repeat protein